MAVEEIKWHSLESHETLRKLSSTRDGLTSDDADKRLAFYGSNTLKEKGGRSFWTILIDQFHNMLVLILLASAIIAVLVGEIENGALIIAIVILNAIFGFIQDYKAERNIQELKNLSKPKALVIRDGTALEIKSDNIVPGDILVLEEGDSIQADGRIIESVNLRVDESSLTGESVPVDKIIQTLPKDTGLPERLNMAYRGTNVVMGRGRILVTSSGMRTELGLIAQTLQEVGGDKTPFQKQMDVLGTKIGYAIILISAIVGTIILLSTDTKPLDVLLIAIALGVAAIPEGLPAVITLALALGSKRMYRKHALLRKLPVAESLGSVDVICTDKTGTLTENQMTVRHLYFDGKVYEVTGGGIETDGEFLLDGKQADPREVEALLRAGHLNNNSRIVDGRYTGDPTEVALLISAQKAGIEPAHERVDEIAFSSARKMMTTVHKIQGGIVTYTKGAPEVIIERCDKILEDGREAEFTPQMKSEVLGINEKFASEALRVIGFAQKTGWETHETKMTFIGLQGMIDPPRAEVKQAILDCRTAGIRVVMITGDNKITAQAVAQEIGLGTVALEGKELDRMSEGELDEAVKHTAIFARVSPQHKLAILQTLKAQGHVVAMTGDGVNDAPAIAAADVGISMGIRGSEVAKQTSDIVLLDDNFATIRDAIVEGRRVFDNVRKFINYLFPCNFAEVLIVLIAALPFIVGKPEIILTAVQLLWINLVTDGLPALALGSDPAAPGILKRAPRKKTEGVINKEMTRMIAFMGTAMALIILAMFYLYDPINNFAKAQTIAFTAIVVFKLVRVYNIRSSEGLSILSNIWVFLAVGSSIILQIAVLYTPLAATFKVVPLDATDWVNIVYGMVLLGVTTTIFDRYNRKI